MKSFFKKWTAKTGVIGLLAVGVMGMLVASHLAFAFSSPVQIPYGEQQLHQLNPDTPAKAEDVFGNFKLLLIDLLTPLSVLNEYFRFEENSDTADPKAVGIVGHIKTLPPTGGKSPTLDKNCGNAKITGTDTAGVIEFPQSASPPYECTMYFAASYEKPPICVVTPSGFTLEKVIQVYPGYEGKSLTIRSVEKLGASTGEGAYYVCLGQ